MASCLFPGSPVLQPGVTFEWAGACHTQKLKRDSGSFI